MESKAEKYIRQLEQEIDSFYAFSDDTMEVFDDFVSKSPLPDIKVNGSLKSFYIKFRKLRDLYDEASYDTQALIKKAAEYDTAIEAGRGSSNTELIDNVQVHIKQLREDSDTFKNALSEYIEKLAGIIQSVELKKKVIQENLQFVNALDLARKNKEYSERIVALSKDTQRAIKQLTTENTYEQYNERLKRAEQKYLAQRDNAYASEQEIEEYKKQMRLSEDEQAAYAKAVTMREGIKLTIDNYENDIYALTSIRPHVLATHDSIVGSVVSRIDQPPTVRIFDMTPPPSVDITQELSRVQREVYEKFKQFKWPSPIIAPPMNQCDQKLVRTGLNLAQKLTYHYMQPYNQVGNHIGVNALLVHSAGSGKTCTASLIMSVFARAGYTIIPASKLSINADLPQAAVINQCDFNIQQWTHGRPITDVVLHEFLRRVRQKIPEISLEKAKLKIYDLLEKNRRGEGAKVEEPETPEIEKSTEMDETPEESDLLPSLSETSAKFRDRVVKNIYYYALKNVLQGKMGVSQIGNPLEALSYQKLGNVPTGKGWMADLMGISRTTGKAKSNQTPEQKARQQKNSDGKRDILRKCLIVIDEAHKIVGFASDLKDNETPNFKDIRNHIWDSYELSGKDSARVLLLTATPISEHPVDLVNLASLLAPRELVKSLGFAEYGMFTNRKELEKIRSDFMAAEFKDGRFLRPDKLKKLLNGRVSYFNFSGDASRFPQPKEPGADHWAVNYIPVKLSLIQGQRMVRCYEQPENTKTKDKLQLKAGSELVKSAKGLFLFNAKTGTLEIMKGIPKISNSTNKAVCMIINSNWPWITGSDGKKLKMKTADDILKQSIPERKKMFTNDEIEKYSPVMLALINKVVYDCQDGKKKLHRTYENSTAPFSDRMRGYKQYIFTDVSGSKDKFGVRMIQALLELKGYVRVNKYDSVDIINAPPYKGMMVFDNKVKHHGNQKELLKYFNSPENIDGKLCSVFINSGLFKEGISLFDIMFVHIVGVILTQADLIQAVARAIRNCSRGRTPYTPNIGWTIHINVYSPHFDKDPQAPALYPLQILEMIQPEGGLYKKAINEMELIMRHSAYDRLLLESINNASLTNEQAVQLWRDRDKHQS